MALQTQTFSLGDFAKANGSNGYVLDLIVTEESTDMAANTSMISYTLQLRSGSSNRFQDQLWASVSIAGAVVGTLDNYQIYAYYNHTYSLISGSTTVGHNADGTLNLAVEGKIWVPDENKYAPPDMTVTGNMQLTQIPRVSQVSVSPAMVEAGGALTIYTNRKSDAFVHVLSFSFGGAGWTIADGVGDAYQWTVPAELAAQIPSTTTGWGTITCHTYLGWHADDRYIGSSSAGFAVVVNKTDVTRPQLSVALSPAGDVPEAFAGLYIQGKTRLHAAMTATPWNSYIAGYAMQVGGGYYSGQASMDSDVLLLPGNTKVICTAVDARGFDRSVEQNITVLPYGRPSVAPHPDTGGVICCRCDAEGGPDINGAYLLVKAGRSWYGLEGRNLCRLRWRCREENGSWGEWQGLLERTAEANLVSTVLPVELDIKTAYVVELSALDDMGEEGTLIIPIGTANTPFHLGKGGRNVGIGRYCDYSRQDAVDVGWTMYMSGSSVKELPAPEAGTDAANKDYVDSQHKLYSARGLLLNATADNIDGVGTASITLNGTVAQICFALKITRNEATDRDWGYGINRDLLCRLNASIPEITPVNGGVCEYINAEGVGKMDLVGYGGALEARDQFWTPARVHAEDGAIGSWESLLLPAGTLIYGICYGTVDLTNDASI